LVTVRVWLVRCREKKRIFVLFVLFVIFVFKISRGFAALR
jgi:hypothetical protein